MGCTYRILGNIKLKLRFNQKKVPFSFLTESDLAEKIANICLECLLLQIPLMGYFTRFEADLFISNALTFLLTCNRTFITALLQM